MMKLKFDLKNEQHVLAAAAFFNTLAAQSGEPDAVQTKISFVQKEKVEPKEEPKVVDVNKPDEELSFGELKTKYPHIKAKSKQNFLAKIEAESAKEETTKEETTKEETKEETTKEETTKEETNKEEPSKPLTLESLRAKVGRKLGLGENAQKVKNIILEEMIKRYDVKGVRFINPEDYPDFNAYLDTLADAQ